MKRRKYKYQVDNDDVGVRKIKIIKEIFIWLLELAIVVFVAYYLSTHMVERTRMISSSMSPTLEEGDKIIINRFAYQFQGPKRFDVIVFKQSSLEHSYYDVKRILGLPGETVTISDGRVSINGTVLEEPMLVDNMLNAGLGEDGVTLDEGEYFVLGDNRNHSEDSRFANVGNVIRSDIVGKAWIKLDPFLFINEITNRDKSLGTEPEKDK